MKFLKSFVMFSFCIGFFAFGFFGHDSSLALAQTLNTDSLPASISQISEPIVNGVNNALTSTASVWAGIESFFSSLFTPQSNLTSTAPAPTPIQPAPPAPQPSSGTTSSSTTVSVTTVTHLITSPDDTKTPPANITQYFTTASSGVTQASLNNQLLGLYNNLENQIANIPRADNTGAIGSISGIGFLAPPPLVSSGGLASLPSDLQASTMELTGNATIGGTLGVSGSGTSTFSNGINLTTGCFSIDGFCIGIGSGSGSVTAVALALPNIFSVTGSPVTTFGTLTATLASQNQNLVFASPNGSSGTPSFRSLVAADIPTLNQNTTGTAANVTGTVAVGNGGTGLSTTPTYGQILVGNSSNGYTLTATSSLGISAGGGGTVTSVSATVPTGLSISGSPITTSGTLAISLTSGYNIPLTASTTNWNTLYNASTSLPYVTSISGSGGTTGLTLTGGPITSSGTLTLGGTLAVANGGTGLPTTPTYGQILVGNSSNGYTLTATSSLGISGGGTNYWTLSGSNLYNNSGTKVGIGTSTPLATLDVNGTINSNAPYEMFHTSFIYASTTNDSLIIGTDSGGALLTSDSADIGNDVFGTNALQNLSGSGAAGYNVAIGDNSLQSLTTGGDDTAVGFSSGLEETTAIGDVSLGYSSGGANADGSNNVSIGTNADNGDNGTSTQTANVFIGANSAENAGAVTNNVLIGANMAGSLTTGSSNIIIGEGSGTGLTSGSNNILIGYNETLPSNTVNGQLNIGNFIYGSYLTGTAGTLSKARIGIGTSTPWATFSVQPSATTTPVFAVASSTKATLFDILASGNVGLGVANPTTLLAISGSSGTLISSSFSNPTTAIGITNTSTTNNTFSSLTFGSQDTSGNASSTAQISGIATSHTANGISGALSFQVQNAGSFSEAMRITSAGFVGIGTNAPASVLTVTTPSQQAGTTALLTVASTTSTSLFNVLGNGNIGIGTSSPFAQLSLLSTDNLMYFSLGSAGSNATTNFGATGATGDANVYLNMIRNTTSNGQDVINFNTGSVTNGYVGISSSQNAFVVSGSGSTYGATTTLETTGNGELTAITLLASGGTQNYAAITVNNAEVARFTTNGDLGIGTTSPYDMLSVAGEVAAQDYVATSTTAVSTFSGNVGIGDSPSAWADGSGTNGANLAVFTSSNPVSCGLSNYNCYAALFQHNSSQVNGTDSAGIAFGVSSGAITVGASIVHIREGSGDDGDLAFYTRSLSAGTMGERMRITANGNVGIGTSSPASTLTVVGSACISEGAGSTVACPTTAGTFYADTITALAVDLAERYNITDTTISAGDVVSLDPTQPLVVDRATQGSQILGIVSTDPGFLLGEDNNDASTSRPIALAGRVPVTVSMENGPINIGDSLTISSTPGVAMKDTDPTQPIIGTALEAASSDGQILVFVRSSITSGITLGTSTPSEELVRTNDSLTDEFNNLLAGTENWITGRLTAVNGFFDNLFAGKLTVGTTAKPTGITLYDQVTGLPYCLSIANGQTTTTSGACGASNSSSDSNLPATSSTTTSTSPGSNDETSTSTPVNNIGTTTSPTTTLPVVTPPVVTPPLDLSNATSSAPLTPPAPSDSESSSGSTGSNSSATVSDSSSSANTGSTSSTTGSN